MLGHDSEALQLQQELWPYSGNTVVGGTFRILGEDHSQGPSPRGQTYGNMPTENGIGLQCSGQWTLDTRQSSVEARTSSVGGNVSGFEQHGCQYSP